MLWFSFVWLTFAGCMFDSAMGKDWESPPYSSLYSKPLPIPPIKQPKQYVKISE